MAAIDEERKADGHLPPLALALTPRRAEESTLDAGVRS
jgi:hypothetical protein